MIWESFEINIMEFDKKTSERFTIEKWGGEEMTLNAGTLQYLGVWSKRLQQKKLKCSGLSHWKKTGVFSWKPAEEHICKGREQAVVFLAERSNKMRLKVEHGVWQDGASWWLLQEWFQCRDEIRSVLERAGERLRGSIAKHRHFFHEVLT